ncbi:MAG: hypothetical protein QW199_00515 [Candidatus Pacearchaeota archaeon]
MKKEKKAREERPEKQERQEQERQATINFEKLKKQKKRLFIASVLVLLLFTATGIVLLSLKKCPEWLFINLIVCVALFLIFFFSYLVYKEKKKEGKEESLKSSAVSGNKNI